MSAMTNNETNRNFIKVLIEILTLYDKVNPKGGSMKNPSVFVKNHVCEMKLFLSSDQDLILSIFYDICLLRTLLNQICKNKTWPKTQKGIVHLYLILFYSTPANLNIIIGSLLDSYKLKKYEDKFVAFLQRDDLIEFIIGLLKKIYKNNSGLDEVSDSQPSDETETNTKPSQTNNNNSYQISREEMIFKEYVEKEIEERKDMFKNMANTFYTVRQAEILKKINYTIEEGHHVLMDYSHVAENNISNTTTSPYQTTTTNTTTTNTLEVVHKSSPSEEITTPSSSLSADSEKKFTEESLIDEEITQSTSTETYSPKSQSYDTQKVAVKMTIAQVLRQGAQIEKKSIKTEKFIQDLCGGSFDPQSIEIFLEDVRKSDEEFELCEIERKHLLGRISLEEARLAKFAALKRNRDEAIELKKHNKELMQKLADYQYKEEIRIREIYDRNHIQQENLKLAQANMLCQKRQMVKDLQEYSKKLAAQNAQKQQDELKRKMNLIRQIKELEHHVTRNSFKTRFGNNLGVMSIRRSCEMSLDELKNALANMKSKITEETKLRRQKIQNEKQRQQKLIQETMAKIKNYKNTDNGTDKIPKKPKYAKLTPQLIELRLKLEQKKLEVAKIENGLIVL